ncbi:EsV-1-199 [Ectocarpus siliculosus]|uniref:EsV-1-199 n=1 Tax=Ectocarpus siliculosus TaxID=2880 RepID=D8LSC5_ECTSI|nr:EsV-1-199 [Ectocarpus siliculosus]|eukprot:CBN75182.1 EsV-1-199 [Ectocarpus siliculosus]
MNQHMDIMAILTGAGVRDAMGYVLLGTAGLGREASVQFLLRQRRKESEMSVHAYANSSDGSGMTPLSCSIEWCSSGNPRIVRLLVDAGADTTSTVRVTNLNGGVEYNDTPLAVTTSLLREKVVDGKPATEEQLHRLQAIRRLLLRVDAVHAVSWLWPSDAPSIVHAVERSCGPEPRRPPLSLTLPILKRRAKTCHVFVATLLRSSPISSGRGSRRADLSKEKAGTVSLESLGETAVTFF